MRHIISVAVFDWDDPATVWTVTDALSQYQSVVIPCTSEEAVLAVIAQRGVDVVVLNLSKPFEKSFRLLSDIQSKAPQTEVIFVAQFDERMLRAWMEVIQRGAYEFLPKPFDREELKHHIVHAAEKHHPVELRKRAPAESVKNLGTTSKSRVSTGA
jgi:DNA-binding NtrC family response regulator